MAVSKKSAKPARKMSLSDQQKKILLILVGAVLVLGGGWWAYFSLTTIAPPNLAAAAPADVVKYLGEPRGFSRMAVERREEYLIQAYNQFSKGENRQKMNEAFARMAPAQRQVFLDAAFETAKVKFVKEAKEFNRIPLQQRPQFVDRLVSSFDQRRHNVGGYGPQDNVAESFKSSMPTSTDGLAKAVVSRTTARERAETQPLFEAVAAKYKEKEAQQKNRRLQ